MPTLSANQITWSRLLIQIHILIYKQCRSRSVGFFRSQQIWIYTVCKGRTYPGSAGPGLKALLGKGQRSDIIIYGLLKSWFVLGLIHYPYMDLTHIRMYIRKSQTKFHKYKTCPLHIMSIFFFFFFFFFFWFGFYGPFKNISLISSRSFIEGGRKLENPEKNHLTIRKQNLAFPHMTRARLEPQRWET